MNKISASKARNNFSDLISKVEYQGRVFLIERYGEVVAKLVPVEKKPVEKKSNQMKTAPDRAEHDDRAEREEKVKVIRKRIKLMLE